MRTTGSNRNPKRASVVESQDIPPASAQPVATDTGRLERKREIGQTISAAMAKLTDIDWTKESPAITDAQSGLDEMVTRYVEGKASKDDVKNSYKAFVNAHRGGLF